MINSNKEEATSNKLRERVETGDGYISLLYFPERLYYPKDTTFPGVICGERYKLCPSLKGVS